ncbi:zinc-binding alcohol dehydrogenase family protein [Mucilaginibacter aquariorum]|uniref:Zinc-binding alcohol dehydrogenase family protein n=1 Tax=Mucilaginibacter aquariorum TaxID=2967225 RepID=A0ABT1SZ96_9SPHI|nr:zinc-binding alcohol dehydrogenase family protein [Mucilaginibacter aquariorum]MCQ6957597.1 zinc-binding alcohol dehydrogenase family protein [Mucilaginibacter aquariorum]
MKAAVLKQAGGPENIVVEDRAIPAPSEGWVLIKVKAFGLNRSELMTRKGLSPGVKFPRVLGIECVGEVKDDPSGEFKPGQKVAAFMGGMGRDFDGGYAEYAVLPKHLLMPFNSNLAWEQLGAMPEMFQTVYGSLHLALKIQPGETLLIRGGTSSIGMLASQLAKNYGLTVIATTRSGQKEDLLLKNGADHVVIDDGDIQQKIKEIISSGVDKVLELVGTSALRDSLACIAPGGTACMTGMLAEQWSVADFAPMDFMPAAVSLTTYDSGQIRVSDKHFQEFINDVESGAVKLKIGRVFSLLQIAEAHKLMEDNSAGGKIVVVT